MRASVVVECQDATQGVSAFAQGCAISQPLILDIPELAKTVSGPLIAMLIPDFDDSGTATARGSA
jgi:hypothetical protein